MDIQLLVEHSPVAVTIFIITIITSIRVFNQPALKNQLILRPYTFVKYKRYYAILTSGIIHADWIHLGFNMLAFYYFAFPLELIMVSMSGPVGHLYFTFLYIACMALADVPSIVRYMHNPIYASLGASGAIAGVIFSMIVFYPDMQISMGFLPFPMKAPLFGILYLVGSAIADRQGKDNIGHSAHFWGAMWGLIITCITYPKFAHQLLEYVKVHYLYFL